MPLERQRSDRKMNLMPRPPLLGNDDDRRQWRKQGGVVGAAASRVRVHLHEATAGSRNPDRWHRASAMMTERLYRRIAYPYERLACPLSNLSVTGFAVTAPLVGEPLAGRRVFGVWRFAPFGSAGVMFASAAEVGLGADRRKDRKKRPHHSKEQWGRFTILQWVPLTQPWGLREPLLPQPLRRALPERQERQRASEPASPRAWGDSDRPSAGRG